MNESANNKLAVFLSAANSLAPSQPFQRDKLLLLPMKVRSNWARRRSLSNADKQSFSTISNT